MVWEIVFMLLILKIPIVYLCVVIWWAIKAEPAPPDPAAVTVLSDTPPAGGGSGLARSRRRRPLRPHSPGHGRSRAVRRGRVRT
jgi:hypothetical protein